ncbi:MAG: hypothetical protein GQ564_17940 [Bacteroidales bacterium]|nr:hypothetical protein [Bacteroidales bacterium]
MILILCIILLQNIFCGFFPRVSKNILENSESQEQLISFENLIGIENLSLFENSKEEEQDQYSSSFNSFQSIINNHYNSSVFSIMKKHVKSFILFESDNSPPLRIRS